MDSTVDTDTTYTAGTGISLVGTQFSLDSTSSPTFAGMSLNGTALPFTDGTFDLGSTTKKWRFVYTDGLVAGGLTYPTSSGTPGQVLTSSGAGNCLLYTSPSPRDRISSRMPSSA